MVLPLAEPIISDDDHKTIKIWIDHSNLGHMTEIEIEKQGNVLVESIYVDITLKNVENEVANLLEKNQSLKGSEKDILAKLSQEVYILVTDKVNKLIDWTYATKQQYWITKSQ